MIKVNRFYCAKCHHKFIPTKEQIIDYHNGKIYRPDTCGFCQVIIDEHKRKEEMKDLNIDPDKEVSNAHTVIIIIIIALIVLMIFYRVISGINERENARKTNQPVPGYNRPVSEMVRTSVQH